MIVFRGCAKCQGDLYVEKNIDDADLVCLQCGFRRTINTSQFMRNADRAEKREMALAGR
jgi:hypothetical protein